MNQLNEHKGNKSASKSKPGFIKKTVIAASAAALLGMGAIGSGLPAMAAPMKQVSYLFNATSQQSLKAAMEQGYMYTPDLSVTHDGITLKLSEVLYDGNRLSFLLEREGANLETTSSPYVSMDVLKEDPNNEFLKKRAVPEKDQLKGYIKRPKILADGQPIQSTGGSSGDFPKKKNTYSVEETGVKLPDEFEVTITAEVTKVSKAFEFKVPIKLKSKPLVLKPNASTSSGKFSYTVKQLVLSPLSTRLILDSKGPVPASSEQTGKYHASMVYYEIVDDKGNMLVPEGIKYYQSKPKTEYQMNELYAPMDDKVASITIKPYTFTVNNKDWSIVGKNKGSIGKKTYLKDLEVTIPIER